MIIVIYGQKIVVGPDVFTRDVNFHNRAMFYAERSYADLDYLALTGGA